MPRYAYIAKTQPHQTLQGDIDAESEQDAINKLTKLGYFPISVKPQELSIETKGLLRFKKVTNRDIVIFTRQLATLIASGVNILSSLNIISNQIANRYLRAILSDIGAKIKDGKPLSDSLALYPELFPGLYTAMIHSGEVGGTLEETLKNLAEFMEKQDEFRSSVRAALTYPIFVFSVGVLTVVILLGFVIPRLVTMFEDMGQALPLPTKVLITVSSGLRTYWWLIIALIGIAVFLYRRAVSSTQGKALMDNLKLKIIILGDIVLKTQISRLFRTLSLLLSSGVSIVSSLDLATSVVENQVIKEEMLKFKEQIRSGESLSRCLKGSRVFPEFATNIIGVGEETGALEKSLKQVADDYERQVDQSLKNISRLVEPAIILVMGLIVGFIVLSMLLPIFQINLIVR